MSYSIVTGYFNRRGGPLDWFYYLWINNTIGCGHRELITIATGNCFPSGNLYGKWIQLRGDLGHLGCLLSGEKNHWMPANDATICAGAMLCYLDEVDFIYKEQDCLAFGPWVEQVYAEIGDKKVIIGKNKQFGAANSLMLVRHEYIPHFVQQYIGNIKFGQRESMIENRLLHQVHTNPNWTQFSFGYDRDRPFNTADKVFCAQQLTAEELKQLEAAGLISCAGMPEGATRLTNWDS